ncbi:hypothetical protein TNCV_5066231 [Trichonephila clavipes]|nr:hypothetical protein TNCV_5066231 [Trichonephila clavipes]
MKVEASGNLCGCPIYFGQFWMHDMRHCFSETTNLSDEIQSTCNGAYDRQQNNNHLMWLLLERAMKWKHIHHNTTTTILYSFSNGCKISAEVPDTQGYENRRLSDDCPGSGENDSKIRRGKFSHVPSGRGRERVNPSAIEEVATVVQEQSSVGESPEHWTGLWARSSTAWLCGWEHFYARWCSSAHSKSSEEAVEGDFGNARVISVAISLQSGRPDDLILIPVTSGCRAI